MSAVGDDGDDVAFACLTGAYWLDDPGGDCRWCRALCDQPQTPDRAGHDLDGRLGWLRVVILPLSVLTVTAAVLVGTLV